MLIHGCQMSRVRFCILVAIILTVLACNAPTGEIDSQATVQAIYVTITAQAGSAPAPTLPATSPAMTSAAATQTSGATPTAPQNRTGNGSNLIITRCAAAIAADANDADWASQTGAVGVSLSQNTFGAAEWTGPADLSGSARLCWTDSALYLFVNVTDDVHAQEQRGETSYKGDEVELMFDADLRGDFYASSWDNDDIQLSLSPGNFAELVAAPYLYHPTLGLPHGVEMNAVPAGTGANYRVEAELLWDAALGIRPTAGQSFGMCVALNDNDHIGEAREDSMVSHCTRLRVSDPTTWITITLQ